MKIYWKWKSFDELTKTELYQILKERNKTFIVALKCPWGEIDGEDEYALHLIGYESRENKQIMAYARLIVPSINSNEPVHFGRLLVVEQYRGQGIGSELVSQIIDKILSLGYVFNDIEILANYTPITNKLYNKFGFKQITPPYSIEGGTELVPMLLTYQNRVQNDYKKITHIKGKENLIFFNNYDQSLENDSLGYAP